MTTLHITNGDCAISLLRTSGITGDYLPWRDVLHMGPVPANLSLSALSEIRATFISSMGWGKLEQVKADFAERDSRLNQAYRYTRLIFWFEHDLYDQLQLIQLFDWLADHQEIASKSFLINPGKHLTHHNSDEINSLHASCKLVAPSQLKIAQKAWRAFRSPNLDSWQLLANQDTSPLAYLQQAMVRSIGELPESSSGCTQTEKMILKLVDAGTTEKTQLFKHYCELEQAPFHGDTGFYWYLRQLCDDQPALLTNRSSQYSLTEMGRQVVLGKQKWQRHYSSEHWLGGYCISK